MVVLSATAIYYKLAPRRYSATAIFAVDPSSRLADLSRFNDFANTTAAALAQLATGGTLRSRLATTLAGEGSVRITAGQFGGTLFVWINASARSAQQAADWEQTV